MACSRAGTSPSSTTKLRLFAESAGFCQNPSCLSRLFVETEQGITHVAEMAHIIAASSEGPRGDSTTTNADRANESNFVLLCPSCHTLIDKEPQSFPEALIREWKADHLAAIEIAFGAVGFACRGGLRGYIEPLLGENRAVFDQYGPHNDYRFDPESDLGAVWQQYVRARILPNNRKILLALDRNRDLLNEEERHTLEAFRLHVYELERRHIGDDPRLPAAQFPQAMVSMAADL